MSYNFAVESFHTKKLCSGLSLREVHFWSICVLKSRFEAGATYAVPLSVIGKLVVDFLLVKIELFSLDVRTEAL